MSRIGISLVTVLGLLSLPSSAEVKAPSFGFRSPSRLAPQARAFARRFAEPRSGVDRYRILDCAAHVALFAGGALTTWVTVGYARHLLNQIAEDRLSAFYGTLMAVPGQAAAVFTLLSPWIEIDSRGQLRKRVRSALPDLRLEIQMAFKAYFTAPSYFEVREVESLFALVDDLARLTAALPPGSEDRVALESTWRVLSEYGEAGTLEKKPTVGNDADELAPATPSPVDVEYEIRRHAGELRIAPRLAIRP